MRLMIILNTFEEMVANHWTLYEVGIYFTCTPKCCYIEKLKGNYYYEHVYIRGHLQNTAVNDYSDENSP